jgi:hypothetical protein
MTEKGLGRRHGSKMHQKKQNYGLCQMNMTEAHQNLKQGREEGDFQNQVLHWGPCQPVI